MRPTWEKAKDLLAEFDGVATEIFVVGIPISQLRTVMEVLGALPALEVLSYKNDSMQSAEPFDASWRARFETRPGINCQHSLRSANGTAHHSRCISGFMRSKDCLKSSWYFGTTSHFLRGSKFRSTRIGCSH